MSDVAPARPDAAPRRRAVDERRRWLPAFAVLAVVVVSTFGGFVVAAALSDPVGDPVAIPGVVSVRPLSGWEPAPGGSVEGRPFVQLTRGAGTLAVVAWGPVRGDAAGLAVEVRDELLTSLLDQLTVSDSLTPVPFDRAPEGRRFTYVGVDRSSGAAVEGEVTTVVAPGGEGVVFVGVAPEGALAFVSGDLRTIVRRAEMGPGA